MQRRYDHGLLRTGPISDLAPGEHSHDARGTTLRVTRGTLWITQEDDTHDIVLRAGDIWMVERDGLTIVEAQNDASVARWAGIRPRVGRRHAPDGTLPRLARTVATRAAAYCGPTPAARPYLT